MFGISNLKMICSYSFLFQRTLRGCYYTTHVTKLWLWMSSTLEQSFLDPSQWQSAASRWLRLSHVNDRSDVWAEVRLVEVARNMNHGAFDKDISQNGKNIEKQCFWAISAMGPTTGPSVFLVEKGGQDHFLRWSIGFLMSLHIYGVSLLGRECPLQVSKTSYDCLFPKLELLQAGNCLTWCMNLSHSSDKLSDTSWYVKNPSAFIDVYRFW